MIELRKTKTVLAEGGGAPQGLLFSSSLSGVFEKIAPISSFRDTKARNGNVAIFYGHGLGAVEIPFYSNPSRVLNLTGLTLKGDEFMDLVQIWDLPLSCQISIIVAC